MRTLILSLTILLFFKLSSGQEASLSNKAKPEVLNRHNLYDQPSEQVRRMAEELLRITKIPGLSIAVRKKEDIIFSQGFGYSDLEKKTPVTPLTQFRAASTSKVITTTALAKMIQDDVINIEEEIQHYVPSFPRKSHPVTVKQLAGNISGIPHYSKNDKYKEGFYTSVSQALDVFSHHDLLFKPGTQYSYSSHGFVLLSAAMEGASGIPFPEYLQESVLNPFSMRSTEPDMSTHRCMPNLTGFYEKRGDNYVRIQKTREMSSLWASGGMVSTPTDLVNMTRAYANGYLNSKTVKRMFESQTLESGKRTQVGIGWRRSFDMEGRNVIEHAGVTEGTRTVISYFPDEDLAISIMVNTDWVSSIEETAHMLASLFLAERKESLPLKGEFAIKTTTISNGKEDISRGKLTFKDNFGKIELENGLSYSVFHMYGNVYALITGQGIYHLLMDISGDKTLNGKATRYSSQLLEAASNTKGFFIISSE